MGATPLFDWVSSMREATGLTKIASFRNMVKKVTATLLVFSCHDKNKNKVACATGNIAVQKLLTFFQQKILAYLR